MSKIGRCNSKSFVVEREPQHGTAGSFAILAKFAEDVANSSLTVFPECSSQFLIFLCNY